MKLRWFPGGIAIVLLFTQPFAVSLRAEPTATIEDLGTLGGNESFAHAVNAAGRVAGRSTVTPLLSQGFVTNGAALEPIPTFGGTESTARSLNDAGLAVGFARRADGHARAFRFDPATASMADLGTLGGEYSFAYGINNAGTIVGYAENGTGDEEAFVWTLSGMQALGALGGSWSWAYGLNDAGQIVGESETADGAFRAFLHSAGAMQDLGTLGGLDSAALAINSAGVVTGTSLLSSFGTRAFRYAPGGPMQELPTLGGAFASGEAIAPDGTIVGTSTNVAGGNRACLWTPAGDVVDLNTLIDPALGWTLTFASGINGNGQIVGWGLLNGSGIRAFRLTLPTSSTPTGEETAPTIHSISASPSVLWPANNKLVPVQVTVNATDEGGPVPCHITGVTSNEPGTGDIVMVGPLALQLRATRLGAGDGRVYRIEVACGNSPEAMATGSVDVVVPKSQAGGAKK